MSNGVLITGGTGALGQALVRRFRADGLPVAFTWRSDETAAKTLADATGAIAIHADLSKPADAERAATAAETALGGIDVLVPAAGSTQVMPFALIELEDWQQTMDDNVTSCFLIVREAVRGMIRRNRGSIVTIGSIAGERLLDVPVHYATAKAALTGFTLSLAAELKRYHIRVNCVVPGLLESGVARNVPPAMRDDFVRHCAMGRLGRMDEAAEVIAFLASERASYVNAQIITVDGGL
jgi:NAD(P)-dependent dehydrogenase (short-subunit alcohol dehydrogenase family)